MARFFFLSTLILLVAQGLAMPTAEERDDAQVYHCANGVDNCPGPQWTCCGPILQDVGGICRKLKPGQVCIF